MNLYNRKIKKSINLQKNFTPFRPSMINNLKNSKHSLAIKPQNSNIKMKLYFL